MDTGEMVNQVRSGILKFDLKAMERAYKRMKAKKKKSKPSYHQAMKKVVLDPTMGILSVYDADQFLHKMFPGKYKRKWNIPFKLDTKDLYKLYRSNYPGRSPFRKTTVEKNYKEWVRYNYVLATKLAGEKNQYGCLLRSPFFWKSLYIQDLLDQDPRKTFEEIKWDRREINTWDMEPQGEKVYKNNECIIKDLWSVRDLRALPMPKWVALRSHFRPKFAKQVERIEEKWEDQLNTKDLKKAEPMFLRVWRKNYEHHLSKLRAEYSLIKTGYAFWYM
jgi:hypothetical protein